MNMHQLSKVLVLSDQYAVFFDRNRQYFLVRRDRGHVQGGSYVVAQADQCSVHSVGRDAGIEKKPHGASATRARSRTFPRP